MNKEDEQYIKIMETIYKSLHSLPKATQQALRSFLPNTLNYIDAKYLVEWIKNPMKWRYPKVSIDTFLDSKKYLWLKKVYPKIREVCNAIINWDYREWVIVCGIGCEEVWTKILMFGWTIKSNQDIVVWDLLMWPDWTSREVLSIHSWEDWLYCVKCELWLKYVTANHILSVVYKNKVLNISVWELNNDWDKLWNSLLYDKDWNTYVFDLNKSHIWKFIWLEVSWDNLYCWDDWIVTHNSWKSFTSQVLACYLVHSLLCLRDPHWNYNLEADKPIAVLNMWPSATQAKDIVFTWIRNFIVSCPRFQQFNPKVLSETIEFPQHKILMFAWNSKSEKALWYNVFAWILDEAAFFIDNDQKEVAKDIFQALQKRITSRFWNNGLMLMISSPKYVGDFIMNKLEESRELDENWNRKYPYIYSIQLPTWKVKWLDHVDRSNTFFLNVTTNEIIKDEALEEVKSSLLVNYIDTEWFWPEYDIWEIDWIHRSAFIQNPEQAKRDVGATPSETISGFFPNLELVRRCYNRERKDPVVSPWHYVFTERPLRLPYYIHIDIWFNKNGKGDHTGFAMWHFGWRIKDEATGETRMNYVIDLVERIWVSEWKIEIDLADVRQRIYDLKAMWFNIALVTFDSYQSHEFVAILRKKNIKAEYVSVDKTIDPYNLLKAAIYENRIDIYYHDVLNAELCWLELIKWTKVDHRSWKSKDVSDAVAWVVNNIQNNTHAGEMWVRVSNTNLTEAEKAQREKEAKENVIRSQMRVLAKQEEVLDRMWL